MRPDSTADPEVSWDADMLVMLGQQGCVLCRIREEAAGTWIRWFALENHDDPMLLGRLERSCGFCPAHTRRLLAGPGGRLMREPLIAAARGAAGRAERGARRRGRGGPGWPGPPRSRRAKAPAVCPPCQVTAEREQSAAGDLAAHFRPWQVAAGIRDHGSLCRRHLTELLPRLPPDQSGPAAAALADRLASVPPGTAESRFLLAGQDPDALARLPYLLAHARLLGAEPRGTDGTAVSPAERLVRDLTGGSCAICRASGREQVRVLARLARAGADPGGTGTWCPRHLHDSQATPGGGVRILRAARNEAMTVVTAPDDRPGRPCQVCQAGQATERRQVSLLRRYLGDPRVRRALDGGHGACLRHVVAMGAARDVDPVASRLVTQLRWITEELAQDPGAWRQIPALLDGEVYLGLAAASSRSST